MRDGRRSRSDEVDGVGDRYDDGGEAEETGGWWLMGLGRCAGFELMGEIWDFGSAFLVRVGASMALMGVNLWRS